jgi:hypothetical protein
MDTIELRLAAGGDCPSVALAESDDGSTVGEGMLCFLTVSSPAASSTLCFVCLGFEELPEQENGKIQHNLVTAHRAKVLATVKERMLTGYLIFSAI